MHVSRHRSVTLVMRNVHGQRRRCEAFILSSSKIKCIDLGEDV